MQDLRVLLPREGTPPRPPVKPFLPGPLDRPVDLPQAAEVRGPSIVLVVAAEFRVEGGLLPVHGVMTMCLAPFCDAFQRSPQALLHRLGDALESRSADGNIAQKPRMNVQQML